MVVSPLQKLEYSLTCFRVPTCARKHDSMAQGQIHDNEPGNTAQIRSLEVRAFHLDTLHRCFLQIGVAQIGLSEISARQVSIA
jgi:hypothetical protein